MHVYCHPSPMKKRPWSPRTTYSNTPKPCARALKNVALRKRSVPIVQNIDAQESLASKRCRWDHLLAFRTHPGAFSAFPNDYEISPRSEHTLFSHLRGTPKGITLIRPFWTSGARRPSSWLTPHRRRPARTGTTIPGSGSSVMNMGYMNMDFVS